jgi:hypothetical protein
MRYASLGNNPLTFRPKLWRPFGTAELRNHRQRREMKRLQRAEHKVINIFSFWIINRVAFATARSAEWENEDRLEAQRQFGFVVFFHESKKGVFSIPARAIHAIRTDSSS